MALGFVAVHAQIMGVHCNGHGIIVIIYFIIAVSKSGAAWDAPAAPSPMALHFAKNSHYIINTSLWGPREAL